jgi:hypothetical protein
MKNLHKASKTYHTAGLRNDGYHPNTYCHLQGNLKLGSRQFTRLDLTTEVALILLYWKQKNQHFWQKNQQLHQFFNKQNQTLHICINICILCTHLFRKGTDTTSLSLAVMTKWSCLPSGYCSSVFAREGLEMICPKIGFSWFFVMWCHQAPL